MEMFLQMGLDSPNQFDPVQEIRPLAQIRSTNLPSSSPPSWRGEATKRVLSVMAGRGDEALLRAYPR
jgi:hypothetical protein